MKKLIALILAVLVLGSFATVAFATEDTPSPETKHEWDVVIYSEKTGTAVEVLHKTFSEDALIEYTEDTTGATGTFQGFEIEGEYTEANRAPSTSLKIYAKSNLKITAKYDNSKPADDKKDDGKTSPATGDTTLLFAAAMLIGLFGVVVSTKKLVKTR